MKSLPCWIAERENTKSSNAEAFQYVTTTNAEFKGYYSAIYGTKGINHNNYNLV